jgi:hypothetical protein
VIIWGNDEESMRDNKAKKQVKMTVVFGIMKRGKTHNKKEQIPGSSHVSHTVVIILLRRVSTVQKTTVKQYHSEISHAKICKS